MRFKFLSAVETIAHRTNRLDDVDGHRTLYLILDRVWADVWCEQFAAERFGTESTWRADYDYSAWAWA